MGRQARHDGIVLAEPGVAPDREPIPFAARPEDLRAEPLRKGRGVAHVIGVGDHDGRGAAELAQVRLVVRGHRHRVHEHVAAGADPCDAVEIDVAGFVEDAPAEEILSMQPFHFGTCLRLSWPVVSAPRDAIICAR